MSRRRRRQDRGAHPRLVARTLAAADGDGITPLAAAFRAGREFLAEAGAQDDLLDEIFA